MMKRLILGGLLYCFPFLLRAADGSLSFTPPPSDYSVVFLGNLFGVVDGVLHGTGSQIMGNMFGVFNAAVLAIGGIIITYTLLVSTMNTAHEGQMLGQKWSSIWIPVRSTLGLALLIPKASGYCLMQIFVMWVVLQGVGAADKVWNAALNYLARGGVIIQPQTGSKQTMSAAQTTGLGDVATDILASQVCMISLQKLLEDKRTAYLRAKDSQAGPCYQRNPDAQASTPQQAAINDFCKTPVPNFINSVNVVSEQTKKLDSNKNQSSFTIPFPNLASGPYAQLNGVCGSMTWNNFDAKQQQSIKSMVSGENAETALMSTAIALQQMFQDLSRVANIMVNNNPQLTGDGSVGDDDVSLVAKQSFGIPETNAGNVCTNPQNCVLWGSPQQGGAPILNGTEFQGAISDFGAIMLPTLRLIIDGQQQRGGQVGTRFIEDAKKQGWMMAGSYFYFLAQLNQEHSGAWDILAKALKMQGSKAPVETPSKSFESDIEQAFTTQGGKCNDKSSYQILCTWLQGDYDVVSTSVFGLVRGNVGAKDSPLRVPRVDKPDLSKGTPSNIYSNSAASTVYGYVNNASVLQIPGQPKHDPPEVVAKSYVPDFKPFVMPSLSFGCGWSISLIFFEICIGGPVASMIYYGMVVPVYTIILTAFKTVMSLLMTAFLWAPLNGAFLIFRHGMELLGQPNVNPIVALAQMGNFYINFAGDTWIAILGVSITSIFFPWVGMVVFVMLGLALPLVLAWLSLMVAIGFMTAFYVPFVPFLIFTFGSIAWIMTVVEAMVAAPIVALGVSHPEGHDAFGKGEQAIMILMNVFLRPSMMIIGYIAAIAMCYVGVWILGTGFSHISDFIQSSSSYAKGESTAAMAKFSQGDYKGLESLINNAKPVEGMDFTSWTATFSTFFIIIIYVTTYVAIVQNAFSLISSLPDKVLRWIGGQPESIGQESAKWGEEIQAKVSEGGKGTMEGQSAAARQATGKLGEMTSEAAKSYGASVKGKGQ